MPSRKPRPGRHKPTGDPLTSKIVKLPTQQRREKQLKHAVTHKDKKTLEDWDDFPNG